MGFYAYRATSKLQIFKMSVASPVSSSDKIKCISYDEHNKSFRVAKTISGKLYRCSFRNHQNAVDYLNAIISEEFNKLPDIAVREILHAKNTSGITGLSYNKSSKRWVIQKTFAGNRIIKTFADRKEAETHLFALYENNISS